MTRSPSALGTFLFLILASFASASAQTLAPLWATADYGQDAALVHQIYQERDMAPIWLTVVSEDINNVIAGPSVDDSVPACCDYEKPLNAGGRALLRAIEAAAPQHADLLPLKSLLIDPASAPDRVEMTLTQGFLILSRLDPSLGADLRAASGASELPAYIRGKFPANTLFWRYASFEKQYQTFADAGGWKPIDIGPKLTKDMRDTRVAQLRANLVARGMMIPEETGHDSQMFDAALEDAVKRFQMQLGLEPDGVAGTKTIESLNVPIEQRLAIISLNKVRAAALPEDGKTPHIIVNIPGTELTMFGQGQPVFMTKVIVGRPDWPTPLLEGAVARIEFNPAWNVPDSILSKEMMPRLQKDAATYLAKENLRVYDFSGRVVDPSTIDWSNAKSVRSTYRLRQDPGDANALGKVKITFPNNQNIYLHDTNNRKLFAKDQRFFSHGCIRVENALDLVEKILTADPTWTREAIDKAVAAGRNRSVPVKSPVPIKLIYLTAWQNADGTPQFRDDPYCKDPQEISANPRCRPS